MKNRPPKKVFVVDSRYPDVDSVGAALSGVLPLPLEKRSSDYLGGFYLLHESSSQVVRVMRNYSSFLDHWTVEDEPRGEFVVVVEKYDDGTRFDILAGLPGFRGHSEQPPLLGDLAKRLLDGDHSTDALTEARSLVRRGLEEELLGEMLSALASRGALGEFAIPQAMTCLEALADVDFLVAGALMARLCPRAAEAFMHHVADAIDLWFGENRSSELAELFRRAAERERGPYMGSLYRSWAENLVAVEPE